MLKRFFCFLLTLTLLAAATFTLAEDAAPAAEEQAPVLLATVNGKEIATDNVGYSTYLNYYLEQLPQYGIEEGSHDYEMYEALFKKAAMDFAIQYIFFGEQADALGIKADPAAREEYEQSIRDYWKSQIDAYVAEQGLSDEATEEERAAASADAVAFFLTEYGYTEDSFVKEYMDEYDYFGRQEETETELTKDVTVSEEALKAYFDSLVNEDKETYEGDAGTYEFYTQYYGQSSYYTPSGYRGIVHILLGVDDDLMTAWKDLAAKLEEQKSDTGAESTATEEASAEAEPTETPEPAEPVTQEMVDAAEQAILDSVKEKVDEIKEKLNNGVSFDDLIKEYGTDSGMKDDTKRAEGYMVHKDSILWDPAFRDAAMALEKIGDISEPVVGQYGVHILQYLRDIPEGAVEMTQEIRDDLTATLMDEAKNNKLTELLTAWKDAADIQYTAEGQAVVDAAKEAEAELNAAAEGSDEEAEAPAEEAAAEETPAE